jgi:hypothetical protein
MYLAPNLQVQWFLVPQLDWDVSFENDYAEIKLIKWLQHNLVTHRRRHLDDSVLKDQAVRGANVAILF